MFAYRLFKHEGVGNFSLLEEFAAANDVAAAHMAQRWSDRPLELWQSTRQVQLNLE